MIFIYLLLLAPLSFALAWFRAPPLWVFVTAAAAIVPLAEWIRRATEQMARRAGAVIGGLLNVTFGNTAEFILALFVLGSGRPDVVKATITGSIIGNSLLGLGVSHLKTGYKERRVTNAILHSRGNADCVQKYRTCWRGRRARYYQCAFKGQGGTMKSEQSTLSETDRYFITKAAQGGA